MALQDMPDQAEEPLISSGEGSYRNRDDEEGRDFESTLLQDNLQSPSLFVWLLTFSAGISGLLFGCKSP
jgi:SP family myo-inositol transporter-like MFS transporter 13